MSAAETVAASRPVSGWLRPLAIPRNLVAAYAASRLLLVLSAVITAERLGAGDLARYLAVGDALVHGEHVRVWEYPIGSLGMVLPPNLLGIDQYSDYLVAFMALAVGLDFATFVAVLLSSADKSWNIRGGWIWVLGPALLGFITLTRLDIAAACLAAAGIGALIRRASTTAAGACLALGAAVKVWPALFLVAALALGRARRNLAVGASIAVLVVLALAFALGWGEILTDFLTYQQDRGLQVEAIAALPLLWADRLGLATYDLKFRFGSQQVDGPATDVLVSGLPILMYIGLAVLAAYCIRYRQRLLQAPETAMLAGFVALLILVLTNKVFSPQYMIWVLVPLACLAKDKTLVPTRLVGTLLAATALTHALFPYLYAELVAGQLAPLLILTARDASMVAALAMATRALGRARGGSATGNEA